jgi:hypothetical protein
LRSHLCRSQFKKSAFSAAHNRAPENLPSSCRHLALR